MEEALHQLRAKDAKERMAALERLRRLLEASTRPLSSSDLTSIVETCLDLVIDGSFRISEGALLALASAAVLAGDHLQIHFDALLPAAVARLGDAKQPVRDAARRLLLTLMEVLSPTIIVERAGSFAWEHKSSRVREEFARTLTSAINLFASTELPLQRAILPPILHMLNDPDQVVREAAICCIEEMYRQIGQQFRDELQRHQLPSYMHLGQPFAITGRLLRLLTSGHFFSCENSAEVKDINTRLERIGPKLEPSDGVNFTSSSPEFVNLNPKKSSPKAKASSRETPLFEGGGDNDEKPVEPLNVYSERQLLKEFEKVASTLVPEKDWSNRISAMQRVEALVAGGATDYPCFGGLLKQLVGPLCTQLSDRRSSIVKQVCHLLSFLSKELLGDFEACAEMFIPVLFKLVVITVLVIAESADSCIKTLLRNCKVARILPRIADCAKNDRNPVLRARCCDYALLILEHWADAAEIQRSVGLYEDLIKCCVGDAMSEVRSTARTCYKLFAKTWPDRARWLFQSFDPAVQRIINEEDGGIHIVHASPSIFNRNAKLSGHGTSAIVAMEKTAKLTSGPSVSSGPQMSHSRPLSRGSEGSLQNIVHSSKKKVTAMESMLRGLDMSRKHNSFIRQTASLDLGVNRPSSRDYSLPLAAPVSNHLAGSLFLDSKLSAGGLRSNRNGSLAFSDITSQIQASRDAGRSSYHSGVIKDGPPAATSYSATRVPERLHERALYSDLMSAKEARRYMNSHVDRQYSDTPYRETSLRESHSSYDHGFHRPLPAKDANGRVSAGRRKSLDGSHYPSGAMPSHTEGPSSLTDALSSGLSPASDWCLKVATFNYIRSLLQQGPRGIQEVTQSFEKVMKLFFKHIDDPHHKVAQAALLTLVEIVPSCRKPFESYMERILPHVFSRLIDPKELVRQPCSSALKIVGKTYGVDSLLPALLRSLDEQRSPKAKLAVIEFANDSFKKHPSVSEGSVNHGILRLWLAKLTPFMHDKNSKLKEATITCFISTYSHYDPSTTLNYILSLSVAEQNSLRRAIKQYTPRVEVDLMNYLQSKKDRQNSRSSYEAHDAARLSSEEGYMGLSKKSHFIGRYASGSLDIDGGRRWSSEVESARTSDHVSPSASDEAQEHSRENFEMGYSYDTLGSKSKDVSQVLISSDESVESRQVGTMNNVENLGGISTARFDANGFSNSEHLGAEALFQHDNGVLANLQLNDLDLASLKIGSTSDADLNIPRILHSICDENNEGSLTAGKRDALQQIIDASLSNDQSLWIKYFDQILSAVLKALDDSDPSVRELALSLVAHMLNNQKSAIEDSVEVMIEKLLRASMDSIPKVANEGENCLTTVLTQYDPFRCLIVIVPLLVTDDEKTLITCINCLSKLVSRVSQEELMARLSSFLPALFDAFEHKSADVRKTVVFCLVDIYLKLGKAFVPYMEGLNSSQLKLVTIYANRISQARTGKPIDASQN